jgi:hypothetical protein
MSKSTLVHHSWIRSSSVRHTSVRICSRCGSHGSLRYSIDYRLPTSLLITHLGRYGEANKAASPKSHLLGSVPRQTEQLEMGFQLPNPETASLSLTPFSISLTVLSYRPTRPQACNEQTPATALQVFETSSPHVCPKADLASLVHILHDVLYILVQIGKLPLQSLASGSTSLITVTRIRQSSWEMTLAVLCPVSGSLQTGCVCVIA